MYLEKNRMTIYVHSRGKSQDHDHSWLKDSQTLMMPEILKAIKPEELIESQKPSLILARSGNQLVLLATALTTGDGRTDFMRRQIRNTVAWVESDNPNSERLLKIAAQALRGDLDSVVDNAVHSDATAKDCGFRVNFDLLNVIGDSSDNQDTDVAKGHLDSDFKVGNNSQTLREELAKELMDCGLPEPTGDTEILVVMTTLKSRAGLTGKSVWRGLSSQIYSEKMEVYTPPSKKPMAAGAKEEEKSPRLGIVIILIIGVMIFTIWLLLHNPSTQNPKTGSGTPEQSNVTPLSQSKTNALSSTLVQSDTNPLMRTPTSPPATP